MINEYFVKKCCCEDISLIENYEKAISDKTQTWDLHHRKETDECYSGKELIDLGLYYNRPASELIFLTKSEHMSLHGKNRSAEHKRKISLNHADFKGEKNPRSKPIVQIDKKTGQVIRTWPYAAKVEIVLGIARSSISACCSGQRKSAGGFVWRYVD